MGHGAWCQPHTLTWSSSKGAHTKVVVCEGFSEPISQLLGYVPQDVGLLCMHVQCIMPDGVVHIVCVSMVRVRTC
jgi:hypothetical protein